MKNNGIMYLFISYVIWGFTPLLLKLVSIEFPAGYLVASRYLIGSVVVVGVMIATGVFSRFEQLTPKQWRQLIILGLIASGLTDILWIVSIRSIGVVLASFLVRLEVPIGVLMASLYLKERVPPSLIVAAFFSLIGLGLIASPSTSMNVSDYQEFLIGVAAAIGVAILWSFAGVYAKQLLSAQLPPLVITWVRLTAGGLFGLVVAWVYAGDPLTAYSSLQAADWLMLVVLGVFSSAVALYLYYRGLKLVKASISSLLLGLSILISTSGGVLLGEHLRMVQWFGVASIAVSLVMTMMLVGEQPTSLKTSKGE